MKILINNIHNTNSTCLIMLLKRIHSIEIEIYGSDVEPLGYSAASNFVDKYFQAPSMDDVDAFTNFLNTLCFTEGIDFMIPSSDKEVQYWTFHAPSIPVKVIIPDRNIVQIFSDKLSSTLEMSRIEIDTPPIINNFFSNDLQKIIFRKRLSASSKGIDIVDLSSDKLLPNHFNEGWFAQKYIDGIEYSVDVFCNNTGEPKIIIPKKKIEMRGGATFRSQLINHQGIIEACQKIYSKYCVPGFSDIEFIEYEDKLFFIEMNLRFSASAICGIVGSFNYVEQYIEHFFLNQPLENDLSYYMGHVSWNSIITRYYEDSIKFSSVGKS